MLLQTTQVNDSAATVSDRARGNCLPNFLRFCPSISTSSSGQKCPSIAFDRPYGVVPSLTTQVIVDRAHHSAHVLTAMSVATARLFMDLTCTAVRVCSCISASTQECEPCNVILLVSLGWIPWGGGVC